MPKIKEIISQKTEQKIKKYSETANIIQQGWKKETLKKEKKEELAKELNSGEMRNFIKKVTQNQQRKKLTNQEVIDFLTIVKNKLDQGLEELANQDIEKIMLFLPDFTNKIPKEKIYGGCITEKNEKEITVCIGKIADKKIEYILPYEKMPEKSKNTSFHKGQIAFVKIENKQATIAKKSDYIQQRKNELEKNGIMINSPKPIFYKPKNNPTIIKGRIINIAEDIFGDNNEIIFETSKREKFALGQETLKKGMERARKAYKKQR